MTTNKKGYNYLEVNHPDNPKPYNICGAHTRNELSNPICTRPAGWGTSHPREGRCKLHGGASLAGPDHPRWKGTRYSKAFTTRLGEHLMSIFDSDEDPMDMLPELQQARAIYDWSVQRFFGGDPTQWGNMSGIPSTTPTLAKCPTCGQALDKPKPINNLGASDTVGDGGGMVVSSVVGPLSSGGQAVINYDEMDRAMFLGKLLLNIVEIGQNINKQRNQTALTKAEIQLVLMEMYHVIKDFVPEPEKRLEFIRAVRRRIHLSEAGGAGGEGDNGDDAAGVDLLPSTA